MLVPCHSLNPLKPERDYKLDLSIRDHRVVAEMLVHLAVRGGAVPTPQGRAHARFDRAQVVEPGENWEDETYNDIQGWELPATWATTVPSEGNLYCTCVHVACCAKVRYAARHQRFSPRQSSPARLAAACCCCCARYTSFGPGCRPNWPERRQLCSFVLPDFPEHVQQEAEDDFNALIAELKKKGKA